MVVKYLGVAYLLFMAWSIVKDDGLLSVEQSTTKHSYLRTAINGTLLNVLNPKLSLFFLAFLPQFVPEAHAGSVVYMSYLAAIFMLMTFIVFIIYGAFAVAARKYVIESPKIMIWIKRAFASTFGLLGLRLALSEN